MTKAMNSRNKKSNTLFGMMVAALAIFMPTTSQAANDLMATTGVADETLFIILTIVALFQMVLILVIAGVIKSIATNTEFWQQRWNKGAASIALLLFSLASVPAMAANEAKYDDLISMDDTGFIALVLINGLLFITFIYLSSKLNGLLRMMMHEESRLAQPSIVAKINQMLTAAVPLEREAEVEMDHEYDGIRELDNNLPPWWLWGFYFTIVFGIGYIIHFHFAGTGESQQQEYEIAMEDAAKAKAAFAATQTTTVDENNVELLTDAAALGAGEKTFRLYCAACHGESGGSMPGGVGPNLTDDHWINGGGINNIYKTIKYGVPAKGMVSWEAQLNPGKIQELASYIVSLYGTNPANAKEPQGEVWKEAIETPEPAPADSTASAVSANPEG